MSSRPPAGAAGTASNLLAWRPRVAHEAAPVDLAAAERGAADLLGALGLPLDTVDMAETPRRMAHAFAEMLTVRDFELTTFPNTEEYDELVLVEDIPVRSVCEHHMLPFVGVAHIGYLPDQRILGLSKFARVVNFFGHRPQTQERLTKQIAEHLRDQLSPRGVGVVIEAEHTCMSLRGVRAVGARTVTSVLFGTLREDPASRAEFLSLTRHRR
ncbi:GTP cyclohydrolase I [Nocardioides mesophilus]|uniref:GTP cyclohydrolase 1 n=1 Tax=Nocardioides mesophilus TaxID=433659 RepID=A0A7G9RED8_9ACTN|nr:GTP cyclohydrolase I [Nocardioides mesophilus]QNN53963.1 GTP cyclohydrolase I [Nocardioides mesophilus]